MSDVLVVIEVLSIVSEKVTEMDDPMDTPVSESAGEVEETVGAVVSSLKAYDSKAGIVAEMPRLL